MVAIALALAVAAASGAEAGKPARAPAPPPPPRPKLVVVHEHDLSTPSGRVALTWPSVWHDRTQAETFVAAEGFVRIFNSAGMEVHRFGDDGSLGYVARAISLEDGEIVVLSRVDGRRAYLRCDFRGELIARFGLTGLPEAFDDFNPDQLLYRGGLLYFAENGRMRVVVTGVDGAYRRAYDLRALVAAGVPPDSERKPAVSMDGFGVDANGNLLFTMSTMFAAGVVTVSGELRLFGVRGSTPGKFNNVGGIDADEDGNVYVTDRLRSVVSVWSPELKHLGDFGYRGYGPSNLITPYDISVGKGGRVFVAQAGKRGVKVFRVKIVPPEPPPATPPLRPPLPSRQARVPA
jgi:hypothetical protein